MHGEGELGVWQPVSGTWNVHALDNPIRSANAFSFVGKGANALAVAGHWFWRNCEMSCSVQPQEDSSIGLVFCRGDDGSAYAAKWGPESKAAPASLRLVRIVGSHETVLARKPLPMLPPFWVQLRVRQMEGAMTVFVDGAPALQAVDPAPLFAGQVGLWVSGAQGAVFDDVDVRSTETVEMDFAGGTAPLALLRTPQKAAAAVAAGQGLSLARAGGVAEVGGVALENVAVAAEVSGLAKLQTPVELRARQNGAGDFVGMRVLPRGSTADVRLVMVVGGKEQEFARGSAAVGSVCRLSLHTRDSQAWGCVDGRLLGLAGQFMAFRQQVQGFAEAWVQGVIEQKGSGSLPSSLHVPEIQGRVGGFEEFVRFFCSGQRSDEKTEPEEEEKSERSE